MALMRCLYCGLLQDEPVGVKSCIRCGGELDFEVKPPSNGRISYIRVQMELDQINAPAGRIVDRHLLITLGTPEQVPSRECAPTQAGRKPLNFTTVLDISGSMNGAKLTQAKEAVKQALLYLHDGDTFSLVTFSDSVRCVFEPVQIDNETRKTIKNALSEIASGGMTALCGGLELGLEKAIIFRQDTNLVLLLSDGQANVGITDLEQIGVRAFQARQSNIVVSTLGVGSDYNEALMVEIANRGGGRFYHIVEANQISAFVTGELGEIANLAARETILKLSLPPSSVVMPLSSIYPAHFVDDKVVISIGDIPVDTELEIPLRLTLPAQPSGSKLSIEGEITHKSPAGNELTAHLNRVTVRFSDAASFKLRDGVVAPVVEHVLQQMKSSQVLEVSRAMAHSPAEGQQRVNSASESLKSYASLLGEERAEQETGILMENFNAVLSSAASPAAAKRVVSDAYSFQRSSKDFTKPKKK